MQRQGKRWGRFLALAFVIAGICLVFWRIDSELRREKWYLKRPTSWWSAQLDNYQRRSGSESVNFNFEHIERPPTPSPPPSVFDKCTYFISTRLGRPVTSDPELSAIFDPGVDSVPVLRDLLQDPKPRVRVWAVTFLIFSSESTTGISQKELMRICQDAALELRDNEAARFGQVQRQN